MALASGWGMTLFARMPLPVNNDSDPFFSNFVFSNFANRWQIALAYAMTYARRIWVMSVERHVKLFKNGRSQAVRIPREFELPGEDAIMRKENGKIVIEAAPPRSLLALLATLKPLDEDFPDIEDPVAEPVDL
jgi:antitoxin VapB